MHAGVSVKFTVHGKICEVLSSPGQRLFVANNIFITGFAILLQVLATEPLTDPRLGRPK